MIYLTTRHNALNFVQCIQNDTPMVALFFFTFSNKINSIHISDFCDIRIVNIGKQTLRTSTLRMWFGIKIFFLSVLRFQKLGKIFKIFNIFPSNVNYENNNFQFFPNIFVAKWQKFTIFSIVWNIHMHLLNTSIFIPQMYDLTNMGMHDPINLKKSQGI